MPEAFTPLPEALITTELLKALPLSKTALANSHLPFKLVLHSGKWCREYKITQVIEHLILEYTTPQAVRIAMEAAYNGLPAFVHSPVVAKVFGLNATTVLRQKWPSIRLGEHSDVRRYLLSGLLDALAPIAEHYHLTPFGLFTQLLNGHRWLVDMSFMVSHLKKCQTAILNDVHKGRVHAIKLPSKKENEGHLRFVYPQ